MPLSKQVMLFSDFEYRIPSNNQELENKNQTSEYSLVKLDEHQNIHNA